MQVDGIQAIGGTGAVRIGMDFLLSQLDCETIYVSIPTWCKYLVILYLCLSKLNINKTKKHTIYGFISTCPSKYLIILSVSLSLSNLPVNLISYHFLVVKRSHYIVELSNQ